ncbi:MAG: DUF2167 domain-containing protein [Acidobacteria bacterium]|nr:DUF2167 domain-containing protein [Acidobacteriota bacterium]
MNKLLTMVLCAALAFVALAQDKTPKSSPNKEADKEADKASAAALALEKQFKFQQGKVDLNNGMATLNIPADFRFLDGPQAKKMLTDVWGNPPSEANVLGMLFPSDIPLIANDNWGVVITYVDDGHVDDKDASIIDHTAMMKEMKEGEKEENEERKKAGYEAAYVLGWAEQPRYDATAKKLYWAKELKFGDAPENTLNYDIRVLGRQGVLSLNAVASMGQLKDVKMDMQAVLSFVEFNAGHRYADYNASTDKLAAYGIGALVAGTLATKAGLFKGLLALLLAGKKFLVIGVIALGALIKKLFFSKSSSDESVA